MNENIFNGRANIYDKYRPSYPQALFDYLRYEIGITYSDVVADIGSGTGILSKSLLNICKQVYAIEPNNDMRKTAQLKFALNNNYISIAGTAENTTLQNHCIDYITVAQAFHWFNRKIFKDECKRILKKDGQAILIWNCRDETNEIVQEIDAINSKYCPDFSGSLCGMRGAKGKDDYKDFFFGNYATASFDNPIVFDQERFLGLHLSASYCPSKSDKNYFIYINALSNYFESHCVNGTLVLENSTHCYVGYV